MATVALRYDLREVLVRDLLEDRDPNLLDICLQHVEKLTPPVGWKVRDERVPRERFAEETVAIPDVPAVLSE